MSYMNQLGWPFTHENSKPLLLLKSGEGGVWGYGLRNTVFCYELSHTPAGIFPVGVGLNFGYGSLVYNDLHILLNQKT